MSSTSRGGQRNEADYYPTPAWCVHRLLEAVSLPGGEWLEPAAGDGAIIRAVAEKRTDIRWTAMDIRPECKEPLNKLADPTQVFAGGWNFLDGHFGGCEFDVVITNPPFRLAMDFVMASLPCARFVAMLLRLNFLASEERSELMRTNAPDVYVLPNRPSFVGGGKTDSIEYCWLVWPEERGRTSFTGKVLASTPAAERRSESRIGTEEQPTLLGVD